MNYFQDFGDTINRTWRRHGYDEKDLPAIACDAIASSNILPIVDVQEVVNAAATGSSLDGYQMVSEFSDLPYVVYRHSRFFVEVLVWTNGTTTVHDHAFSGAFGVASGDSICVTYDFERTRRVNARFHVGKLTIDDCEHLQAGDIRPIEQGADLIHSVYHVARPTVTLVVRTITNPDSTPQLTYRYPSIAIENDYMDPVTIKQFQAINIMLQLDAERFQEKILDILDDAPLDAQYWIVRGMDFDVLPDEFEDRVRHIVDSRSDGDVVFRTLERERLSRHSLELRPRMMSSRLRIFLASVLNIPDQRALVAFLRKIARTDNECREMVRRCVKELFDDGLIRWTGEADELSANVVNYLFDRSMPARDQIVETKDLLLTGLVT